MNTRANEVTVDPVKLATIQFTERITNRYIAKAGNIAIGTVSGIRNGRCRCKVSTAEAIAGVLGVPVEEILKDE